MAAGPLHDVIAPIFTGPVGAGVVIGTGVAAEVAVGTGVAVGAKVTVAATVGVGVFSSLPQAGTSKTNKLKAMKRNQYLFDFNMTSLR
jgi:hypothetical protein